MASLSVPGDPLYYAAVDEIAGLEFDSEGMAQRMELVEAGVLKQIVASLDNGDSNVRCKAANALGCLSANPDVAATVVRDHLDEVLPLLEAMVMDQNIWLQADSFFVMGFLIDAMTPSQVACLEAGFGVRSVTQFVQYTKNMSDTREKVESLRTYSAVLCHKLLSQRPTMHAKALENGLGPALLSIVAQATAVADVFQLSLRMIYTLASSSEQSVQHALLDLRTMAVVAPLRKQKDLDVQRVADAVCVELLAANKRAAVT